MDETLHILVVDDHHEIRELPARYLRPGSGSETLTTGRINTILDCRTTGCSNLQARSAIVRRVIPNFRDTAREPAGTGDSAVANICREKIAFRDNICDGSTMLFGYARVSADDQDLTLQRAALKDAGCRRIYEEKVSGARRDRPQLARLLDQVREQDVVVVYRLDRLARSTHDLLGIAEQLRDTGAGLRSLGEPWADTTSPAGRVVLTVFAGIAEFERALIHERTGTGRAAAMRRGVRFGRPAKLATDQVALARRLLEEGTAAGEVARMFKVHRATLYRALNWVPPSAGAVGKVVQLGRQSLPGPTAAAESGDR
jgi:DNA invertase Pin-like site-specific DNA recombinase